MRRRVSAAHALGRLSVEHHPEIRSRTVEGSKGVFINEHSVLKFSPKKTIDIERSCYFNELIQDLFVILTGSDYRSPWSRVLLSDKSVGTLYYFRLHSNQKPPERHKCLTFFADVENDFGTIFFSWLEKSQQYGPGFYLYLSTRRGIKSYTEQRFFSLVSGLETLHRSIYGDEMPQNYQSKMDRIIKNISSSKDRKWLENKLQRFAAPNLDQRLFKIFSSIPIGLKADHLKTFCIRCAKIRNSLAHHGHVGATGTTDDDAYRPIFNINDTISCLYHLFIMTQIGVADDKIDHWVSNRMGHMHTRHHLELEKLIEKRINYKTEKNGQ